MPSKEPRRIKVSDQQPRKSEKPEAREISDVDLETVSGGLSSTGASTISDTSVCLSQL